MANYTKFKREIKDDKRLKGKQSHDKASTSECAGKVVVENIQNPASADTIFNGWIDDCVVLKKMGVFSKRKRDAADVASDGPLVASSMADAVVSFASDCKSRDFVEACNTCFKTQKVPNPPKASELSTKCIGTERLSATTSNQHGLNLGVESLLKVSPRKCDEQEVVERQRKEMEEFSRTAVKEKIQLVKKKKMEEADICLHRTGATRSATLKKLNEEYQLKKIELNRKMNARLKNLVAMQVEARKKVLQRKGMWVEEVRSFTSWTQNKLRLSNSTKASMCQEQVPDECTLNQSDEDVPLGAASQAIHETDVHKNFTFIPLPLSRNPNPDGDVCSVSQGPQFQEASLLDSHQGQPPNHEALLSQALRHVSEARTLLPCNVPLDNEMERLIKEAEQTIKIHEETKLQLKSDCEKEMEETLTQMRKRYETKLKEVEAEFLLKQKELDANRHKVVMNQILADNNFPGM